MMSTRMTAMTILIASLVFLPIVPVGADRDDTSDIAMAEAGAGLTIYLDVGLGSRKGRAAKKMNELHRAHYARGWQVVDIDPYIENGDLQGFFITYVGRDR